MSSGFRAMLGVAAGTFLIIVLAVAGATLGVAAFTGVQGPWPDGPVAQAMAAFSRNGTLAVVALALLVILGCLPGIGPRSWASLNPIVRRTGGLRGISVSDLLDISVARAVGFVAAAALLGWAAPYAGLDGPATTAPVAALPAPTAMVTALVALLLLALPYAVAGLFSLRRESEFVDDYRIRPYDGAETDQDDWRHLRERETGGRRGARTPAVPAQPVIEPLFPAGVVPASSPASPPATPDAPQAPAEAPAVPGAPTTIDAPQTRPEPEQAPNPDPVPVAPVVGVPVTMTTAPEEPAPAVTVASTAVGLADLVEPVLVFTVAADPADPVMVFSPASGVEQRFAPPVRRVRPSYTPASRVKADDLLGPTPLLRDRRSPVPAPVTATDVPGPAPAPVVAPVVAPVAVTPKKRKKKRKGKKKSGQAPVNVTVHVHMPPSV